MTFQDKLEEILQRLEIHHGLRNIGALQSSASDHALDRKQATQAIKQIILAETTKARIDELKRLKQIDAFNELYTTDPRPAKLVSIRLTHLTSLLGGNE